MDRRSFLASLAGLPAAFHVTDTSVTVEPAVEPVPPGRAVSPHVVLAFGDLELVGTSVTEYSHRVHDQFDPRVQTYVPRPVADVRATNLVAPGPVWEAIVQTYADVTKAATNPPLTVRLVDTDGEHHLGTFSGAVITAVGTSAEAGGFVVVESLSLVAVWDEMATCADAYNAERKRQIEEHEAAIKKFAADNDATVVTEDEAGQFWCEDCTDFHN